MRPKKGFKLSKEHKRKIAIAHTGNPLSEEHKKNMSKGMKGKFLREKHPRWKGGKYIDNGYVFVLVPKHPFISLKRHIQEHRLIIEKHLGRYLKPSEMPHHINHIRNDNRPENLMLFANRAVHNKFEKGYYVKPKEIVFDGRLLCQDYLKN